MKKSVFSLIFLFSIFLFCSFEAAACSCMQLTTCEAYARAKIVFVGRIVKASSENGERKHQVQVEETFLGMDNTPLVDVFTDQSTSCAFRMSEGQKYLIFAWKNEKDGTLSTGMCSHTNLVENVAEDLEFLRSVKDSGKRGGTLQGIVTDVEDFQAEPKKPAQVDKVYVENKNGERFETAIKADGKYELAGLSAGEYKISVDLPKGLITDAETNPYDEDINPEFTEIAGQGCTIQNFLIKTNGIVSGRVLDADGLPAEGRNVNLLKLPDPNKLKNKALKINEQSPETEDNETPSVSENDEPETEKYEADYDAYTDEDGFYIFKGLSPGRYMLGVGIDDFLNIKTDEDQYLPTYFPSSKKKETAIVIELKKAEVLTDKNIQLFPKLKKRKITGQIIWKNGRFETKAEVDFYGKRDGFSNADWGGKLSIDAKGNFSFEGYEETEYLIKAEFAKLIKAGSFEITHSSKCFIIPKNGAVKPIKLILETGSANCDEDEFRNK